MARGSMENHRQRKKCLETGPNREKDKQKKAPILHAIIVIFITAEISKTP